MTTEYVGCTKVPKVPYVQIVVRLLVIVKGLCSGEEFCINFQEFVLCFMSHSIVLSDCHDSICVSCLVYVLHALYN